MADPSTSPAFHHTLSRIVAREAGQPREAGPGECSTPSGGRCSLCLAGSLTYEHEYPLKSRALREFWSDTGLHVPLADLVPSSPGRQYRFVSKRKAYRARGAVRLGLINPTDRESGGFVSVGWCAIEPPAHAAIYEAAGTILRARESAGLASVLRYLVVKGDREEHLVLLNLTALHSETVREATRFSKLLARSVPTVKALLLYEDLTSGRYYLGSERGRPPRIRKIYGRDSLLLRVEGRPFLFGPLAFSQVNPHMIESLVRGIRTLLDLRPAQALFDLYCGYGLFGLSLAGNVRAVFGVEAGRDAVDAARENARRQHVDTARFIQSEISGETIGRVMRDAVPGDAVILDPPRGGTAPGVIEGIAARSPARVVHIFCNIDGIKGELTRWASRGYLARTAVPYDLFPGTASVEVMILLTPSK